MSNVQAHISKMIDKGLAPRTVRYAVGLLRSAMNQAIEWHLLNNNPLARIQLPRKQQREMVVPDLDQINKLVNEAKADALWPLWILILTTGLRPGECLGLKWQDIDFDSGRIVIQRSIFRIAGEGWKFSEPKTARSKRMVTAPESTIEALRIHRIQQDELRLRFGSAFTDHGLVFTTSTGEPPCWSGVRCKHWLPLLKRAGIKNLRPYDLRHLHASLLLSKGVSIRAISERLGHFDPGFTLSVYTHTLPGTQEVAAAVMGETLFGGSK